MCDHHNKFENTKLKYIERLLHRSCTVYENTNDVEQMYILQICKMWKFVAKDLDFVIIMSFGNR